MFQVTTRDHFMNLLRREGRRVVNDPLFFGQCIPVTHAVAVEDGVWRIRRLVFERARADANYAEHGMYMPEPGEMEYKPGPDVVLEAATLEALVDAVTAAPWPLP